MRIYVTLAGAIEWPGHKAQAFVVRQPVDVPEWFVMRNITINVGAPDGAELVMLPRTLTARPPARPSATPPYAAPMAPVYPCRELPTRHCPAMYGDVCGDRPCARFESDDEGPWRPELPAVAP